MRNSSSRLFCENTCMTAWKWHSPNIIKTQLSLIQAILFGLCHFHAVMLERKKFGPMGYNMMYPFSNGDLRDSASVLYNYLEVGKSIFNKNANSETLRFSQGIFTAEEPSRCSRQGGTTPEKPKNGFGSGARRVTGSHSCSRPADPGQRIHSFRYGSGPPVSKVPNVQNPYTFIHAATCCQAHDGPHVHITSRSRNDAIKTSRADPWNPKRVYRRYFKSCLNGYIAADELRPMNSNVTLRWTSMMSNAALRWSSF